MADRAIVNKFMFGLGLIETNAKYTNEYLMFDSFFLVMVKLLEIDVDFMLDFAPPGPKIEQNCDTYVIDYDHLRTKHMACDWYFK